MWRSFQFSYRSAENPHPIINFDYTLPDDLATVDRLAASMRLQRPAEPQELFVLSAQKNLMQEWVAPLVDRLGEKARQFIEEVPWGRYLTLDQAIEAHRKRTASRSLHDDTIVQS